MLESRDHNQKLFSSPGIHYYRMKEKHYRRFAEHYARMQVEGNLSNSEHVSIDIDSPHAHAREEPKKYYQASTDAPILYDAYYGPPQTAKYDKNLLDKFSESFVSSTVRSYLSTSLSPTLTPYFGETAAATTGSCFAAMAVYGGLAFLSDNEKDREQLPFMLGKFITSTIMVDFLLPALQVSAGTALGFTYFGFAYVAARTIIDIAADYDDKKSLWDNIGDNKHKLLANVLDLGFTSAFTVGADFISQHSSTTLSDSILGASIVKAAYFTAADEISEKIINTAIPKADHVHKLADASFKSSVHKRGR